MSGQLQTLLSIAGSDPMGGAGIQADIKVGSRLGLHVLSAVTTITAQNSLGLIASSAVSSDLLKLQLDAIREDVRPSAVKIGMVGDVTNLLVIADFIDSLPKDIPVVVDPILKLTKESHKPLFKNPNTLKDIYRGRIFPHVTVITPNLIELEEFTGKRVISDSILKDLNAECVIVKGGHNEGNKIEDTLVTYKGTFTKQHERNDCKNLHGTGCVFSSFLASYMALGHSLQMAFEKTCDIVSDIISQSKNYSLGSSTYGPLNINENYILR